MQSNIALKSNGCALNCTLTAPPKNKFIKSNSVELTKNKVQRLHYKLHFKVLYDFQTFLLE